MKLMHIRHLGAESLGSNVILWIHLNLKEEDSQNKKEYTK